MKRQPPAVPGKFSDIESVKTDNAELKAQVDEIRSNHPDKGNRQALPCRGARAAARAGVRGRGAARAAW
jgi:hypothetical protein